MKNIFAAMTIFIKDIVTFFGVTALTAAEKRKMNVSLQTPYVSRARCDRLRRSRYYHNC